MYEKPKEVFLNKKKALFHEGKKTQDCDKPCNIPHRFNGVNGNCETRKLTNKESERVHIGSKMHFFFSFFVAIYEVISVFLYSNAILS